MKRYLWLLPTGLVLSVIALVVGLVLRSKNAPQLAECGTKLGMAKQLFSATARATCASAKSMTTTGNAVMIGSGVIAAVFVVIGIAYFVTTNMGKPAT